MLSIIVAVAKNNVIGRGGDLPWRLSDDLQRFKRTTMGHHLIMGRKTYESIGRPLPGRTSIVLTRTKDYAAKGCLMAANVNDAIQLASGDEHVFVIGGAQVYSLLLPRVQRLHWTSVDSNVEGDVFFPTIDWSEWTLSAESKHVADEKNQFNTSYRVYDRSLATQ